MAFKLENKIIPQNYLDKESLLPRIGDLEFVDDVSEFKCRRCGKVLLQHYISNCGHAFCLNCKKLLGDGSGGWKCPQCQEYVKEIDFQDFEFERKLFDLRVFCANKKYGCSLSCLLKDLSEHLKSCDFTRENALPVLCEEPNTTEKILNQMTEFNRRFGELSTSIRTIEDQLVDLINHQAQVDIKLETINNRVDCVNLDLRAKDELFNESCHQIRREFKNELQEFNSNFQKSMEAKIEGLSDLHTNVNAQLKIIENKMDIKMESKELPLFWESNSQSFQQQIDQLRDEIKSLRLNPPNNDFEFRIDMVAAENASVAWKLDELDVKTNIVMPQVSRLESFIKLIQLQMPPITFKDVYAKRQADFLWTIDDVKTKLKQNELEIESDVFRSTEYPFEMRAKLKSENGILLVSVSIEGSDNINPSVYLILRDQAVDERDWDIIRSSSLEFGTEKNKQYSFQGISKTMLNGFFNRYLRNNSLMLKIYVEPPLMATHAFSFDGVLSCTIENYRKRKESESGRYVLWNESPYFYTSPDGYRVQVRFMLSYKDIGVAADIRFLRGEFDEKLGVSFPHKTTVTILNQKHPNGNITSSKTKNSLEMTSYIIYLGTHRELESFIENDALHYHLKVEPM